MAGLDYTIEVHNKAMDDLKAFQEGTEKAKAAMAGFKAELESINQATQGLKKATREIRALGNDRNTRTIGRANQNLSALGTTFRRVGQQAQGLIDTAVALNAIKRAGANMPTRGINAVGTALVKLNANLAALNVQQAVLNVNQLAAAMLRLNGALAAVRPNIAGVAGAMRQIGQAAGVAARGIGGGGGGGGINPALVAAGGHAKKTEGSFGSLSRSMSRLFVAFVAFRAFSAVTSGFRSLVTTGLEFNRTIEQAQLSLAALITQNFQVKDSQGQLVQGAQAFAEAQKIAAQQVAKLRVDALKTTATLEELFFAVQAGVGAAGQGSGLDVNEAREISVLLAQAASTLQISGDKFAEEIRSILTGSGRQAQTRLLQAVQLSPEEFNKQVRIARAQGKLFEFLQEQFKNFALLSSKNADTFNGRLARLKESLEAVAAAGALPFFNSLKSLFSTISDQLVKIDVNSVVPKPEAVQIFSGISEGMAEVVREGERIVNSLSVEDFRSIGDALGESFKFAARVVGPAIEGMIRNINALARATTITFRILNRAIRNIPRGLLSKALTGFQLLSILVKKLENDARTLLAALTAMGEGLLRISIVARDLNKVFRVGGVLGGVGLELEVQALEGALKALREIKSLLDAPTGGLDLGRLGDVGTTEPRELSDKNVDEIRARAKLIQTEAEGIDRINRARLATLHLETLMAGGALVNTRRLEVAQAEQVVEERKIELEVLKAQNQVEQESLLTKIRESQTTAETLALREQLTAEIAKGEAEARAAEIALQQSQVAVDRLNLEAERPITLGVAQGLNNLDLDPYTEAVKFIEGAIQGLSATISEALLDAFLDPTKDIREGFAQLFRALSQQLLQLIIQAAIVKGLQAIGTAVTGTPLNFSLGGSVNDSPQGFASGGQVPGRGNFSLHHLAERVYGFAGGGGMPGVAASDTVPAMLTPGEWVIRLAAVQKAGPAIMAAINEGRFDREKLAEAVGLGSGFSRRRRTGMGYATGGQVAPSVGFGPTPAFVVASDEAAARFLAGGRNGFLGFMRDNASAVNAVLGVKR